MLFNSFTYLLFFPVVCIIYYLLPQKSRWYFLLGSSYFFYMNWEPMYALLIMLSTVITFSCAKYIHKNEDSKTRKRLLLISIVLNFGILFLFKYYNFLTQSIFEGLSLMNVRIVFPRI